MSDPFNEGPAAAGARRKRSLAIALALVAFVVIVFGVTLVQLSRRPDDAPPPRVFGAAPVTEVA